MQRSLTFGAPDGVPLIAGLVPGEVAVVGTAVRGPGEEVDELVGSRDMRELVDRGDHNRRQVAIDLIVGDVDRHVLPALRADVPQPDSLRASGNSRTFPLHAGSGQTVMMRLLVAAVRRLAATCLTQVLMCSNGLSWECVTSEFGLLPTARPVAERERVAG